MFTSLPLELYYKILNFGAIEPPHFVAYKTATIRPIFSCELYSNISEDSITLVDNDDDEMNTDEEYFLFLLTQDL